MASVSRFARVAEAAAVLDLLCTGRKDIPLSDKVGGPKYVDWMRDRCKHRQVWVINREGVLAAMLVLIGGQIMYLVTRPEFRRLGLSRQLIAHVQARKQELLAKVRPTNQPILNTLLGMGFERACTYDDPPWDAYLWKKSASVREIAHSKSSLPLV